MTRLRHRWSDPLRQSSELTIYTCLKCGLVEHSNHDWSYGPKGSHWKSWFEERNPELRLTVMPECIEVEVKMNKRTMACRGAHTVSVRSTEHMERCRACGTEIQYQLVDHPFWGFKASCEERENAPKEAAE